MKQIRQFKAVTSIFLAVLFLIYAVGCQVYRWTPISKEEIKLPNEKPLDIYLVEQSRPAPRTWTMYVDSINRNSLSGAIRLLSKEQSRTIRKRSGPVNEWNNWRHVIIELKKDYAKNLPDSAFIVLPMDQVGKIEIHEYDRFGSITGSVLVAAGGFFTMLVVIALTNKGQSCPFIYAENPGGRVFEGEIYSGATYPQLERHDWLSLPHLKPTGETYRIAIANEVKEAQHTNLLELVAVDHPLRAIVLFDKYGRLHTMPDLQAPLGAVAADGQDIREQILWEDSLRYLGPPDNNTPDASETLTLQFRRPPGAREAKLVINAKNSMWLDHAHGLMVDGFGEYGGKVRENFLKKSAGELQNWMLRQNIPLTVWLETAPGQWERADHFNLAGPMALKRDVLTLDLSKVKGEQIRVKLSTGFKFWEIDYVGMDFTPDQAVQVQTLAPVSAVDRTGADLTAALRADDALYYDQPNVGDEAVVTFPAPPLQPGLKRSVLLHSKGHYQILREPAPGKPSPRYLKQFARKNAFPVFAREQWRATMRSENLVFKHKP